MPRVITPVKLPQADAALKAAFMALRTRADLSALLGVTERELVYILYRGGKTYIDFDVPKKSGGVRKISAPSSSIKILQKRLNQVLRAIYTPKTTVHGFAMRRSIVTNADKHVRKRVLLNLDLEDFFPSIHFGRVRGIFTSPPFSFPMALAQVLAQICTHNRALPQGAPTSPIISNMICGTLDSELRQLAELHACTYTRYADDITFSTTRRALPEAIAVIDESKAKRLVTIGDKLRHAVESNSFKINQAKVRIRTLGQRREVTGLVVHHGVNVPREYVRGIRGLLHAWEKFGYVATETELRARHHRKHRRAGSPPVSLIAVAAGKLEFLRMVRGVNDLVYVNLWNRFAALAGSRYSRRMALVQALPKIDDALWLLESQDPNNPNETIAGTAFALEGQGLVTCAHCLGNEPIVAFQPRALIEQRSVTITHRDAHVDLARLTLDVEPSIGLRLGDDTKVQQGDLTIVAGFGNYAPGGTSRLVKGHITARAVRHGVNVLYSDHRAYSGNSGGAVLDQALSVIGVLQRAVTPDAPGQETTILPISLLQQIPAVVPPAAPAAPAALPPPPAAGAGAVE